MTEVIEKTEYKKGYKKTKLGWIPEDWDIVHLDSICDVRDGTHDSPKYYNYGIPFLTSKNLTENGLDFYNVNYISEEDHKKFSERSKVENGDILFGMIGTIGNPTIVNTTINFSIKNMALIKFFKDTKINNFYLLNTIKSKIISNQFSKTANEGVQSFISLRKIRKLLIPLPLKEEQEKIAEILSAWDDGIETLEKLIEQKEILKNSLAQKCFRRKNILFSLKQHKLGELFKNRKETNCCDLELLSVCDGLGIVPRSQLNAKDNSNDNKSKYLKVCIGDLAYNTMRMWQGRCGVSSYEGIVSPAYTVCIPKNNIDVDYMYYLFKAPHMIHDFWRYSQGIVDDTLNLKFNNFEVIKVWIPDKETQTKIAKLLKSYDEEIQLLNSKLEKLKEQKKGLMQKLLTGQIRVKI